MTVATLAGKVGIYNSVRMMRTSCTTPSSSTTSSVKAKAKSLNASTTVKRSTTKATATASTKVSYSSSSSTAKVSSTTLKSNVAIELEGSSAFFNNITKSFKIGGYVSAKLYDFYEALESDLGVKEANLKFSQTIAACCYEGKYWDWMSGWDNSSPQIVMLRYGLSSKAVQSVVSEIRSQHENAKKNDAIDMAHMFFTIATYLNKDDLLGSAVSRGITGYSDEIIAGFGGDVFGINMVVPSGRQIGFATMIGGMTEESVIAPSMGNDDYMADLDSVNISQRLNCNSETSIIDIITNYYKEIERGQSNRANEFLENMGGEQKFFKLMSSSLKYGKDTKLANKFYNAVVSGQQVLD